MGLFQQQQGLRVVRGFSASPALITRFSVRSSSAAATTTVLLHLSNKNSSENDLRKEAEHLMNMARDLRSRIPSSTTKTDLQSLDSRGRHGINEWKGTSKWQVPIGDTSKSGVGYRLELDIGREGGTWMDPRWGASGKRMAFTLDVLFSNVPAIEEAVLAKMVKDNLSGKSSSVSILETAPAARLRSGFDSMKCDGGAYRIDGGMTARFYVNVEGTPERGSSYGDIFVPKGQLYFSLPCFGSVSQLSSKEGIVTVRQVGWHTGWRREESRIVGTVRAIPIEKAVQRDGF